MTGHRLACTVLMLPGISPGAAPPAQILFNTQPTSYNATCTPVTATAVGQSVIPPGTNIPTTASPPPQVHHDSPEHDDYGVSIKSHGGLCVPLLRNR